MSHTAAPGTAGGSSPGGRLARRLLPAAVVVALLLEWIQWAGEQAGWYSSATSILLFAGATAVIFASLILTGARWINRLDRERRQAEIDARDVVHQIGRASCRERV